MSRSRADLIAEIARDLNQVGAGEEVEPEVFDVIDGKLTSALAELASLDILYVGNDQAFEDDTFDAIAAYTAAKCTRPAGISGQRWNEVKSEAAEAERALRRIAAAKPKYYTLAADYF